jgi:hypothetical protein
VHARKRLAERSRPTFLSKRTIIAEGELAAALPQTCSSSSQCILVLHNTPIEKVILFGTQFWHRVE